MKYIITEEQFNNLKIRRRLGMEYIGKLVNKYLLSMGKPNKYSKFYGIDDYYDEVVRRVITELTMGIEITLGQKIFISDIIRKNFANRIEHFHKHGELL